MTDVQIKNLNIEVNTIGDMANTKYKWVVPKFMI